MERREYEQKEGERKESEMSEDGKKREEGESVARGGDRNNEKRERVGKMREKKDQKGIVERGRGRERNEWGRKEIRAKGK